MNYIKNLIPNIFIFTAAGLDFAAKFTAKIGFKLHITFKTDVGAKLVALQAKIKEINDAVKQSQQDQSSSKLFQVIRGGNDEAAD